MEVWKMVDGFHYEVSNLGRVRNTKTRHVLNASLDVVGYPYVTIYGDNARTCRKVHRLVSTAFLGPRPPGLQCNHINGIKTDNRVENLEWVTCLRNQQHASEIGLKAKGGNVNTAVLTDSEVRSILADTRSQVVLAAEYGVATQTINHIKRGRTWKHLSAIDAAVRAVKP